MPTASRYPTVWNTDILKEDRLTQSQIVFLQEYGISQLLKPVSIDISSFIYIFKNPRNHLFDNNYIIKLNLLVVLYVDIPVT